MSPQQFDLIVLGSGPSGGTVAVKAAKEGRRVAMIESREFGGTCALRGCNPKKVYVNSATVIDQANRSEGKLIANASLGLDWQQLLQFKRTFTQPVAENKEESFNEKGIATFQGSAQFTGPNQLEINGQQLSAERILIATGAKPVPLDIPGEELLTTSDEFLELEQLPQRIVFLGGGYISLEFAHVVLRYGVEVTVIEQAPRILTGFEDKLVEMLTDYSHKLGIQFHLKAAVNEVTRNKDGALSVSYGKGEEIACDLVVHGAGRVPDLESLTLSAANIDAGKQGVEVDQYFRSVSNPAVFATGDCAAVDVPNLTPVATEQARIVTENLFEESPSATADYGVIPRVAFTIPAIASVGLSEAEAKEKASQLKVNFEEASNWTSVRKTGETVSAFKVFIDQETDHILGAHLLGPGAEECINLFALAMKFGLTATDIKSTLFAFPTFSADVRQMV